MARGLAANGRTGLIASGDRFDPAAGELHANPASHDLKQDFNPARGVQSIKNPQRLCKGSGHKAYLLTTLESIGEREPLRLIGQTDQRLHDPFRRRNRTIICWATQRSE